MKTPKLLDPDRAPRTPRRAPAADLDRWAEQVLFATSIDEVFGT